MPNIIFNIPLYFHVLVVYGLFYKRNRKHFFPSSRTVIETLVEVWENSKLRGNTRGSLGELEIAGKHYIKST